MHCWVRDAVIENTDVGVNFSDNVVNCAAAYLKMTLRSKRHTAAMRNRAHRKF
jgi:hypothetical protein